MESSNSSLTLLDSTSHIPIAELSPTVPEPSTKAIKAIVTLTWPYSSATGSVAFLLSEPDFRLRRARGQVRVQFAGSSAKRVAKSSIASGDEVVLCLDGVEWIQDDGNISTPGRGIEFELRFTERVLLKFRQEEAQDSVVLDIDHPPPESELPVASILPDAVPDFIPLPTPPTNGTSTRIELQNEDGIYSSPAFVKRARTSYGSLFEMDPFSDEDGTVKGKGRKRTRLSSTWTYTSRSPTPEVDVPMEEEVVSPPVDSPKPVMTDEGCQTMDLQMDGAAESLANFSRQAMNVGSISYAGRQPEFRNNSNLLNSNGSNTQPPSTQTDLVELKDDFNGDAPHIPQPPKIQPISSASLPLVSPLIQRGFSMSGYEPTPNISELGQTPDVQQSPNLQPLSSDALATVSSFISRGSTTPGQQSVPAGSLDENGHEDLYNASPVAINRGESAGLAGVETNVADVNKLETSQVEPEFNLFSPPTAVLSHHSQSPLGILDNSTAIPDDDAFGIAEHQNNGYGLENLQQGQVSVKNHHEYPDFDGFADEIWTPDIPQDVGADHSNQAQQRHQSTAMSRSQSARSQQSPVVDLTETDEEEDAHGEPDADDCSVDLDGQPGNPQDYYLAQDFNNDCAGSQNEEEMTENEYTEDEEGKFVRRYPDQSGEEFGDEEEMGESEDDAEDNEQYDRSLYPQGSEEEDEDEEGSYDEDESMDDEEPRQPISQGPPVVIDLLSSDDEDDAVPPPKITAALHQAESETPEEEDEEESNSDVGPPDILPESGSESGSQSGSESETYDKMETIHGEAQELDEDVAPDSASGSGIEDVESEPEEMDLVPTTALPDDPYAVDSSYGAMPHDVEGANDEVVQGEIEEAESEELIEGKVEENQSEEVSIEDEAAPGLVKKDQGDEAMIEDGAAAGPVEKEHNDETTIEEGTAVSTIGQAPNDESLVIEEVAEEEFPNETTFNKDQVASSEDEVDDAVASEVHDQEELTGPEDGIAEAEVQGGVPPTNDPQDYEEAMEIVEAAEPKTADEEESEQPEDNQSSENAVAEEADAMEVDEIQIQQGSREASEEIEATQLPGPASATGDDESGSVEVQIQVQVQVEEGAEVVEELVENIESVPQNKPQVADDVIDAADEMDLVPTELEEESFVRDKSDEKHTQDTTPPRTRSQKAQSQNAKSFGADGAHDISPKRTRRGRRAAQLPTPDDTQVSQNVASTDVSFTNISQSQEAGDDFKTEIDESELRPSLDVDEALLDESTVIDKIVHEAEATAMDEVAPPDEETVIERIVEEAKATALESMSPQNPPRDEEVAEEERIKITPKKPTGKKRGKSLPEPETTAVAPRRSHRRDASQNRPQTPTKPNGKKHASPNEDSVAMVVVEQQNSPMRGHDASAELALSSLESPSKQRNDVPQSAAEAKVGLASMLKTNLPEFSPLKTIRFHLNAKLDFLAIVTTTPPEPTRNIKMRQYQMSFNVTDSHTGPNAVVEVQISHAHIHTLPAVKAGDGILLRDFKVIAAKNRGFALSADHNNGTASWAVFKGDDKDEEPEMRGRPVELGDSEKEYVALLKTWFHTLADDTTAQAKLERANAALADSSPAKKGAASR